MPMISSICNLSNRYTNHSLRTTSCTILGRHHSDIDIQAVSGHKSLSSLGIYKKVENEKKINMSNTISQQLTINKKQIDSADILDVHEEQISNDQENETNQNQESVIVTDDKTSKINIFDDFDWNIVEDVLSREGENTDFGTHQSARKVNPIFNHCNIQNFTININKI